MAVTYHHRPKHVASNSADSGKDLPLDRRIRAERLPRLAGLMREHHAPYQRPLKVGRALAGGVQSAAANITKRPARCAGRFVFVGRRRPAPCSGAVTQAQGRLMRSRCFVLGTSVGERLTGGLCVVPAPVQIDCRAYGWIAITPGGILQDLTQLALRSFALGSCWIDLRTSLPGGRSRACVPGKGRYLLAQGELQVLRRVGQAARAGPLIGMRRRCAGPVFGISSDSEAHAKCQERDARMLKKCCHEYPTDEPKPVSTREIWRNRNFLTLRAPKMGTNNLSAQS